METKAAFSAILPADPPQHAADIQKTRISPSLTLGTTTGLKKAVNEDRVGHLTTDGATRFCVADGHWGDAAAAQSATFWLDGNHAFPSTEAEAIKATSQLNSQLFTAFGHKTMDADKDFTPETSLLACEISGNKLRVVSYGDCRLLVVRSGQVRYRLETRATWLGAFAELHLRGREAIADATIYETLELLPGDYIFAFSDGVDECVYEKPTISMDYIAHLTTSLTDVQALFDALLHEVNQHGAEDNASLVVYRA